MTKEIIIIYLIILKISLINSERECNKISDCFNCSYRENLNPSPCYWNTYSCISSNSNVGSYDFSDYFENCIDSQSINIQKEYCGDFVVEKKNIILSFPEVNGNYSKQNLYCSYNYKSEEKKDAIFKMKFTKNNENILDTLTIKYTIIYFDDTEFKKTISPNEGILSYDRVKYIKVYILSKSSFTYNPFTLTISYEKGSSNIGLFIALSVILLVVIACSIGIYFITKKIKNRINSQIYINNNNSNNNNNNSNSYSINNSIKNNNAKIIESMLSNEKLLGERICKKEDEKYGTNCTICLEEFKIGVDKVSITPCNHVFHFKCMRDWLRKENTTYKCPICNLNLLNPNENIIHDRQNVFSGANDYLA